ncbi:MAG TPA: hypothetical protein VNT60_09495 [Deinococcales bacterium]|nr:hypothetical protein [Deinococcales bacterium]
MLVYLDQNYASRIAKHLLGQASHARFGELHAALRRAGAVCPPSQFHVLETRYPATERDPARRAYLLPTLQELFAGLSGGQWVRPWREVLDRQAARWPAMDGADFLTRDGNWDDPADLGPAASLATREFSGAYEERVWQATAAVLECLDLPRSSERLPFVQVLAPLLALRSLERYRRPMQSDVADLLMAATVRPYADVLATDRYVRESLARTGWGGKAWGGRDWEVADLTRHLVERGPA